jgi:two-component system chemotaxis response regulator CheB
VSLALEENLTRALASALRALDERIALAQRMQQQAHDQGRPKLAASWVDKVREFEREASAIRSSIRRADELAAQFARDRVPGTTCPGLRATLTLLPRTQCA